MAGRLAIAVTLLAVGATFELIGWRQAALGFIVVGGLYTAVEAVRYVRTSDTTT